MNDVIKFGLYRYKDRLYYAFDLISVKNQHTRKWENSVIYISMGTSCRYVRELSDFMSKFKEEVNNENRYN